MWRLNFCPIVRLWFLQDEGSWLQNGAHFSPFFFPFFFLATHFSLIWCYTSSASFNLLFLTFQLQLFLLHFWSAEKSQCGRVISLVQLLQPFNPSKGQGRLRPFWIICRWIGCLQNHLPAFGKLVQCYQEQNLALNLRRRQSAKAQACTQSAPISVQAFPRGLLMTPNQESDMGIIHGCH